jgi:hypothetical protein
MLDIGERGAAACQFETSRCHIDGVSVSVSCVYVY